MDPIYFLHAGASAFLLGFFIFDIILSRALFAFGAALFIYGFATQSMPAGWAILWSAVAILANLAVIWRSLSAQFKKPLTPEEQALAKQLNKFSKADFRKLLKITQWQTLDAPLSLTQQGEPTRAIYYLFSGSAIVQKNDTKIEVGEHALIGEISYAKGGPATATVEAQAETVLLTWPLKKLNKAMKRASFKAAFNALLNQDLSEKLAADEARREAASG